jgi:hypothetical protein
MKRSSINPSMRKAMRVATVFTGAATAAAVFTPAAMAGTGPTNRADKDDKTVTHQPMDQIGKARPMNQEGRQSLSIQQQSCSGRPHWVHIEGSQFTLGRAPGGIECYGYRGTWDVSDGVKQPWHISHECGGNNFGYLNFKYASVQGFGEGKTYRGENLSMNSIYIGGWSQNDTCP